MVGHRVLESIWHGLEARAALAFVEFVDDITGPDLIGAAVEAHELL